MSDIEEDPSEKNKEDESKDGENYDSESNTVLFASSYAISVYMTHHRRNLYSYVDLLSDVGGLSSALFTILYFFGKRINNEFLKDKIARVLYFVKSHDN